MNSPAVRVLVIAGIIGVAGAIGYTGRNAGVRPSVPADCVVQVPTVTTPPTPATPSRPVRGGNVPV